MRKRIVRLLWVLALTGGVAVGSTACGNFGGDESDAGSGGSQAGNTGGSSGTVVPVECTNANVEACGGDMTGIWNVAASCLTLTGDMDVSLTSLGCPTVPVEGSLEASGTFIVNADGTYTDNTTTTGSVEFPLDPSCLSVSSVPVACGDIGDIFEAVGWSTGTCVDTAGQCNCALTVDEAGGLGSVVSYVEMSGSYSTEGMSFTAGAGTYDYCAAGDTLTITPQMSGLLGRVVFLREGLVAGTGGGTGTGGAGSGGSMGTGGGVAVVGDKPCDIYDASGTSCVAAHSTVRALFKDYSGPLYQVRRGDGMTQDIPVLTPGGFANASVQDEFCGTQSCTIWRVYDQTGNGNFLHAQTQESPQPIQIDPGRNTNMRAADAKAEKITVSGHEVYSLFTRPAQAYWNDGSATGMPLGASPQGIYMVTSGTHYNGGCCYDYGNAQLDRNYHGGPTMDTVYFGSNTIWGTGEGEGPWVMADMEDGMLASGTPGAKDVAANKSLPFPFVTAMEKNNGTTTFALKGADATQPVLTTMWDGPLPASKSPMQKEGAVILGAGGDCCYSNDNASEGTFYEGAIVAGYPSDETDNAIHANIVETGYGQ